MEELEAFHLVSHNEYDLSANWGEEDQQMSLIIFLMEFQTSTILLLYMLLSKSHLHGQFSTSLAGTSRYGLALYLRSPITGLVGSFLMLTCFGDQKLCASLSAHFFAPYPEFPLFSLFFLYLPSTVEALYSFLAFMKSCSFSGDISTIFFKSRLPSMLHRLESSRECLDEFAELWQSN